MFTPRKRVRIVCDHVRFLGSQVETEAHEIFYTLPSVVAKSVPTQTETYRTDEEHEVINTRACSTNYFS